MTRSSHLAGALVIHQGKMAHGWADRLALFGVLFLTRLLVPAANEIELQQDFYVPPGVDRNSITADYFTSTLLEKDPPMPLGSRISITLVNSTNFQALTGLSLANALVSFLPQGINAPHSHPRASETLWVQHGTLIVGFIDTTEKLFLTTLVAGDLFVFPEGLVHFQANMANSRAQAYAAFSSSGPGRVSLPQTLFASRIPDSILRLGFNVPQDVIAALEAAASPGSTCVPDNTCDRDELFTYQ